MNWITIYLTGRGDFREDVRKKLERSPLNFMPGYIGHTPVGTIHDLYWLEEGTDLRTFKGAIGSRLIWKYRLRFFISLEEFIQSQDQHKHLTDLTQDDLAQIDHLRTLFAPSHP